MKADEEGLGTAASDSVVFAIFGLIVAFTFSTATSRFNERRELVVEQANALGTASLRIDALHPEDRLEIRQHMLKWVELSEQNNALRINSEASQDLIKKANVEQMEVWRLTAAALDKKQQPTLWTFVMGPINDWIDLTTKRFAVGDLGTPPAVLVTLLVMSLVAAVLAGFNTSHKPLSLLHSLAFASIVSLLMFVIMDIKSARSGLIRAGSVDYTMTQVGESIKAQMDRAD